MGTIPTEPEERRAYFAALGRTGGAATLERYGASHYAALGKQGFATTLGRYGGDFVWRLLRDSYLRKYPDRTAPPLDGRGARERSAARRGAPTLPRPAPLRRLR